jgi:hypothetical protein
MTQTGSKAETCFLRSDTKLELLAFRWYAWPHLVAPLQHAMNMAFRHVPLLESYLANPDTHAAAVKDPRMLGAPVVDIASKQSMAVTVCGRRFVFLVDSDAVDAALYRRLARIVPKADALFVGMECHGAPLSWFYGPLLGKPMSRKDDESRRGNASNCLRAAQAIDNIECRDVYVYVYVDALAPAFSLQCDRLRTDGLEGRL